MATNAFASCSSSKMLMRSLSQNFRRAARVSQTSSSTTCKPYIRLDAQTFSTSALLRKSDSPTGNDAAPARTHRSSSSITQAGPDVEAMTGQPKNTSTESAMAQRSERARKLTELTQSIGQEHAANTQGRGLDVFQRGRNARSSVGLSASATSAKEAMLQQQRLNASPALAPSGYSMTSVPLKADPVLKAFINNLMRDGKKATATRYVLDMLRYLGQVTHADPLPIMKEAIRLASPLVRMQTRKEGGKNTQVPLALFPRQSRRRGIVAILEASSKRNDTSISVRMAKEIIAVLDGSSAAMTRKMDVHKLATVNRGNTGVRV